MQKSSQRPQPDSPVSQHQGFINTLIQLRAVDVPTLMGMTVLANISQQFEDGIIFTGLTAGRLEVVEGA